MVKNWFSGAAVFWSTGFGRVLVSLCILVHNAVDGNAFMSEATCYDV